MGIRELLEGEEDNMDISVRWYRGSGKRVLTPRRDNPKGPKMLRRRKPKKIGLPRKPGVDKPHVSIPFVTAKLAHGGKNTSVAGLNAVMRIAHDNGMTIDKITWITAQYGTEHECRVANDSTGAGICDLLGAGSGWTGKDAMRIFQAQAAASYPLTKGFGLWALSHLNCKCSIRVEMEGPQGRASFIVNSQTDPSEPKKSDMAGGDSEQSIITNIESGYSFDPTPGLSTVNQQQIKQLSPEMLNMYKSFHTGDEAEVEKFTAENDMFGRDIYVQDIKQTALPPQAPLAPGVEPAAEEPYGESEFSAIPEDVRKDLEEARKRIEEQERIKKQEEEQADNPNPNAPGV